MVRPIRVSLRQFTYMLLHLLDVYHLLVGAYCTTRKIQKPSSLPLLAMWTAFPSSDYYSGSAPTGSDHVPYPSALRPLPVGSPVAS
jgi:hypothetical protein